jgi:hypothetical protein
MVDRTAALRNLERPYKNAIILSSELTVGVIDFGWEFVGLRFRPNPRDPRLYVAALSETPIIRGDIVDREEKLPAFLSDRIEYGVGVFDVRLDRHPDSSVYVGTARLNYVYNGKEISIVPYSVSAVGVKIEDREADIRNVVRQYTSGAKQFGSLYQGN